MMHSNRHLIQMPPKSWTPLTRRLPQSVSEGPRERCGYDDGQQGDGCQDDGPGGQEERAGQGRFRRFRQAAAFDPAATLLYSAPGFVLHGPVYLMFVSMFAMLVYSFFASKDIIVMAPLTLQRQAVTIQAVSGGLVESVEVGENSVVSAGDPLATIQEKIRAASTPEQEAFQRQIDDLQVQEREAGDVPLDVAKLSWALLP